MRTVAVVLAESAREQLRQLRTAWPMGAQDVARAIDRLESWPYTGRYIGGEYSLRVSIAPQSRYQIIYKARPDYDTDPRLEAASVTNVLITVLLLVPPGANLEEWLPYD